MGHHGVVSRARLRPRRTRPASEHGYSAEMRASLGSIALIFGKSTHHRELSDGFVCHLDGTQYVRKRSRGLDNVRCVARVDLRLSGVEVCDASHREPGEKSDGNVLGLCDSEGECHGCCGLVNGHKHAAASLRF